jgi:uncharacterized protein YciI
MNKIGSNSSNDDKQTKYYMLYYKLVPDILEKRTPYKDEHMRILEELSMKGLVFVGAEMKEGYPAVFMFEGKNDKILHEWLKRDPYINNGLVIEHHFNQILLVAGRIVNQVI